jgi:predicted deacylase
MQKLGKNIGKYLGEVIDIDRVLRDVEKAAANHSWRTETFLSTETYRLLGLTRKVLNPEKRIYISTGIHGDEPAGPLAVLQMLQENRWPANADIWLCPCLNPTGLRLNTRENAHGVDLNRDYLNTKTEEIRAHIAWLEKQPGFDVCLCLHEDWESQGFYVYELNPDKQPSLAEPIVKRVSEICPIDMSGVIEDRPASGGIIRPIADPRSRPQWPEAFYLFTYKTRLSYTLEAPSDFQLPTRVAAEVAGVQAVLEGIAKSA